jgi:hypothetical protein
MAEAVFSTLSSTERNNPCPFSQNEMSRAETQAHHVAISPQKDRGGTKGTVGEVEGG